MSNFRNGLLIFYEYLLAYGQYSHKKILKDVREFLMPRCKQRRRCPSFRPHGAVEALDVVLPESMKGAVEGFDSVSMGSKGLFHWRAFFIGGPFPIRITAHFYSGFPPARE
jgi:hypothetical protein